MYYYYYYRDLKKKVEAIHWQAEDCLLEIQTSKVFVFIPGICLYLMKSDVTDDCGW
jgi:hypothetical protein